MSPPSDAADTQEIDLEATLEHWRLLDCLDAPVVVVRLTDAGQPDCVEFGNDAACVLLTFHASELHGRAIDAIFAPDAIPALEDACGRVRLHAAITFDAGFLTRAQEPLSVTARARRVEHDGTAFIVVVVTETGARRRSAHAGRVGESRFSGIVEQSADGILLIAAGGTILYSNPAAASLFGLPRELLVGSSFGRPMDVDDTTEIDIMRADGSGGVAEMRITPTQWMGNQAYVATLRDITDRIKSEGRARREAQLKSLELLAGGMVHDLDRLLGAVSSGLSRATDAAEGHRDVLSALTPAAEACERALELAAELLSFGSDDDGDSTSTTELDGFIEELVGAILTREDLTVTVDVPHDLWKSSLDTTQLGRVVQSLISNAEEAVPADGKITVTGRNILVPERGLPGIDPDQLRGGDYVRLTVADDGVGIPEELRARVFDPFVTATDSGRGLGLAMCYSIVSKHGGHVHVDSVEGRGTTIHVFLPAVRRTPSELEETSEVYHEPIGNAAALAGRRLLVMDDDPSIREMLSRFLATQGAIVTVVEHGVKAVARYERAFEGEEQSFDAVLLDSLEPRGMSATGTLERLVEVDPDVVAVVAAGAEGDPMHREYAEHGFRAVVTKPFDLRALARSLQRLLANGG